MNRPTGVTLISVFFFVMCGLLVVGTIAAFVGGAFIGSLFGAALQQRGAGMTGAGFGAMVGAILGVFFLIGAALNLICGIGLWKVKEWARILTIVLCGLGAALGVLGLFIGMIHFNIFMMMWRLLWLAIDVGIVWYLLQPEVKAAFARIQLPPQAYATR
ncbi:MAG TPA: hypothetical protein VGL89_13310 [Candidatus Koribacter sp.]|jgi:hypothetical protein